jgi:hypothetical protein
MDSFNLRPKEVSDDLRKTVVDQNDAIREISRESRE